MTGLDPRSFVTLFVVLTDFFFSLFVGEAKAKMFHFIFFSICSSPLSFSSLGRRFLLSASWATASLTAETNVTIHALWPQLHGPRCFRSDGHSLRALFFFSFYFWLGLMFPFFLFLLLYSAAWNCTGKKCLMRPFTNEDVRQCQTGILPFSLSTLCLAISLRACH